METATLTSSLAMIIMRWGVGPERFTMPNRRWIPSHRFRPFERIEHAFQLLYASEPQEYRLSRSKDGSCHAQVRTASGVGEASAPNEPVAITLAIAKSCGIEVDQ